MERFRWAKIRNWKLEIDHKVAEILTKGGEKNETTKHL